MSPESRPSAPARTRFVSLARRDERLTEIMDDPNCDPERLRRTLQGFGLVNRAVASWGRVYRTHLRPVLAAASAGAGRGRPARVLDVGCGGGDVLRRIVASAARDGIAVQGVGIDPDPRAIAVAAGAPRMPGVAYRQCFSSDLVAAGERFDVVLSNHLLHHLAADELSGLLADSEALATGLAVHSDIARSRLAYAAFAIGAVPVSPGTLLRVDGLRSIRRSYTPMELAAALPPGWNAERVGLFRLLAVQRPRTPGGAGARVR
ncbi:Methyltransferase domain-containing protein [Leucobacter chromiiresistens]|uniref:Methyltransferase domain-containing protein n=1 Tax=Leucobacter chromiiresistens TaxID=1079994 RepID=A0A1H0ZKZ2_9MICO|nr:Methyltransferase domain-containing protein [Leucobacter chromiiresistens]